MRYGITILITSITVYSFGQTLSDVGKRLKLLAEPGIFQYDTAGFSALPKIDNYCDNENKNASDFYHLVDLNNDGQTDLLYSGTCKPSGQTIIYLRTGNKLKKVGAFQGKIVAVDKYENGSQLHIMKEVCCCYPFNEFTQVMIDSGSNITKNTITFGTDTRIRLNNRLKEEKVMGTIRTSPKVYDVPKADECKRQVYRGNQLRRIEGFKNVIQLSQSGTWWLVLYPETSERSWIGWMLLN